MINLGSRYGHQRTVAYSTTSPLFDHELIPRRRIGPLPQRAVGAGLVPPAHIIPSEFVLACGADALHLGRGAVGQGQAEPRPPQEQIIQVDHALGPRGPAQFGPQRGRARDGLQLIRARGAQKFGRGMPVAPEQAHLLRQSQPGGFGQA